MTRWSNKDLPGMLIKIKKKRKLISGTWSSFQQSWTMDQSPPVWPEYWKLEELESPSNTTQANGMQWMQESNSRRGSDIKT